VALARPVARPSVPPPPAVPVCLWSESTAPEYCRWSTTFPPVIDAAFAATAICASGIS
jgi:hypothetical protein